MIDIKLDIRDFEVMTERMGAAADQIPFALSRALNDAANDTYEHLIEETWPKAVTVRNSNFLRHFLKTKYSSKYDLTVEIYDSSPDQRGHLALHAEGGIKTGKGAHLAIPTQNVDRGSAGVYKNERPSNLPGKVVKGNAIYQQTGRGKNRKLKLMYLLVRQANQPADVPFEQDFRQTMLDSATKHFTERMAEAMKTRR